MSNKIKEWKFLCGGDEIVLESMAKMNVANLKFSVYIFLAILFLFIYLFLYLNIQHHYASNMRLVVMGGYPLDYLQKQVVKCFSDVRSKNPLGSYTWDQVRA